MEADADMDEFPLPNVEAGTLSLVVRFMEHHREDPKYKPFSGDEKGNSLKGCCTDPWDPHYFDAVVPDDKLVDLLLASNYMDIGQLLRLCAKTMALKKVAGDGIPQFMKQLIENYQA
uniref:SKP1 component POZ domain-containing protein n=1 Tax=Lotharella globosa TaxID=91324 RepID=A0A7S3Z8W4_9EUKA